MDLFSTKDLLAAEELLKKNAKGNQLLFSEGTYQIGIKDKKETFWPFLQISDSGQVLDALCSCKTAEAKGSCPHLAAAYLKIMQKGEPLHVRFRESFWNQIGQICAERHGFDVKNMKKAQGGFEWIGSTGKRLFFIRADKVKAQKHLEDLLLHRPLETEETSLKFSNLPSEELALWRSGQPSKQLLYELSFWSDLAKWWMQLQEEGAKYSIRFSSEDPPQYATIRIGDLEIEFYIDLAHWEELIPSLQTVDSPLKVHPYFLGKLDTIVFLPKTGEFLLEFEEEGTLPQMPAALEEGVPIGQWLYFSGKGFFPKEKDPLLSKTLIPKYEVETFLDRYLKLIQKHSKEKIHPSPISVQYQLKFNEKQALQIEPYLFEPNDLKQEGAHYFGSWVFLPKKGFFRLENQLFEGLLWEIPKEKVSDFINRHRVWLHSIEGYQTHVSGVESHLGYRFDEKGKLQFFTRLEFTEEKENIIDLGEWIYVKGKGFYAKITSRPGTFVIGGMEISPSEISTFIHQHREELEPIPGFFSYHHPLEKTGLNIQLKEGRIHIAPEFFYAQGYSPQNVKIFGDYTYVENEGFSLIPQSSRLPDSYKVEKTIDRMAEPYFVGYELDLLYPHVLTIDPRLKRPEKLQLRLNGLKREEKAKTGQWVLDLTYESEIGEVSPREVWEGIWQNRAYLFTPAGLLFLRDKRFDWLKEKNKKRWLRNSQIRFNTLEFFRLTAFEDLLEPEGEGKKAVETRQILRDFLEFKAPTGMNISGLQSTLRPYQQTGALWLWFLYSYGLSGLLCDEMGLGKTHQAMALLAAVKNQNQDHKPKFLVVCPTSVIYHWEKLIHTFLPTVKPYVFHGIGRNFETFSQDSYDLLLTSYGIVRTENEALSNFHFDVAVFDELQVAKNEKSMTYKALSQINASMRLGLTGTPIENRLLELKALFDLIVPTYFPSQSIFREHFVNPIEKYHDDRKRHWLARLIRPFLLRRKKSEVLTELPEKIEEVVPCDLSDEQKLLYNLTVETYKPALLKELEDSSKPPPIAHVFALLTKLKQICDHPCLITKDVENYKQHQSGKWDLFLELLDETRDSGQKLVVFTQYLDMLDIMKLHLKEQGIGFAEIRGSTRNRKEEVERFSADPTCEVFLGSLQAAGVGIDLIAASVVIHYDRWWNPAKENQATDRVHRMGQKRGVQVFKLMTINTIEEQINQLIERKMGLAAGVIGFDDQDQIKGLHREELIELLRTLK